MPRVSPARQCAFQVLERVEAGRGFAVELLQREEVSVMKEADRRLATELVMGVLRRRGELDLTIERASGKPLEYFEASVAIALRLGIYQIRFLDRIPKSAAVNESVELVKAARRSSAAGLVNAVLRKCERLKGGESRESIARALPEWLAERWARNFGAAARDALARASLEAPPTTIAVTGGADERDASDHNCRDRRRR